MSHIPDWWINRMFSAAACLICGYCLDTQWYGCAVAWFAVSGGFLIWSLSANELRP